MRRIFTNSFYIVFFYVLCTQAQQELRDSSFADSYQFDTKLISAAGISGIYLGTLYDSYVTWWRDSKRPFTMKSGDWFDEEGDNGIDKMGHFYTSYAFYKIQKNIFLWGGFRKDEAQLYSGVLTGLMALIIEVGDGFSRYGFCYKDFLSNSAGLTFAILQDEFPILDNINFKWSYFPSEGYSFPPKFSNHYEGHIYWVTINSVGIFNEFTGSEIPEYVQPAFGYSINKYLKGEYFIGLDFNLLPLFGTENPLVKYAGELLNLFHLPAPGIKYSEGKTPEYKLFQLR